MLRLFGKLSPFFRPQIVRLASILLFSLALSASAALQPWPLKIVADYGVQGRPLPPQLQRALDAVGLVASAPLIIIAAAIATLLIFALGSSLDSAVRWLWASAGQCMVYAVAEAVYARLTRLSLRYHASHSVGDSLTRIAIDPYAVYTATHGSGVTPIQAVFTLATVGAVAWQLDPYLTMLSFALAPVVAIAALYSGREIRRHSRAQVEARSNVAGFVHQSLENIPLVQSYGTELIHREKFDTLSRLAVDRTQRASLYTNLLGLGGGVAAAGGSALVLLSGGHRVLTGAITVGTLLVFLEYLRLLQGAMRQLLDVYGVLKQTQANVERVVEVLESREIVPERSGAVPVEIRSGIPAIEFDSVSFAYDNRRVLTDISFVAWPGQTIALVGPTGAGKTTLFSLVPRFSDPEAGRVLVYGRDVREFQLASLRSNISLVLQDAYIFAGTIAENIAYARPGATLEQIEQAAMDASLGEFIARLPRGFETVVGERGATLSGGQKQRIAIARALLRDAPILLLDEPTSSMDVETEAGVLDALERLMRGRTTMIISHRLSALRTADQIIVIERGRILESGTHQALSATDSLYRKLLDLQSLALPGLAT